MIQYTGVIQAQETMQSVKVCWKSAWNGDAERLDDRYHAERGNELSQKTIWRFTL